MTVMVRGRKTVADIPPVRLPSAVYDEEQQSTVCTKIEKSPLQTGHVPVAMSFGLFDSYVSSGSPYARSHRKHCRTRLLSDPNSFEEPLLDTTISVIVDELGQLVSVSQYGPGSDAQQDTLLMCIAAANGVEEACTWCTCAIADASPTPKGMTIIGVSSLR